MAKSAKTPQGSKLVESLQVIYYCHPDSPRVDIYFNHQGRLTQTNQEVVPECVVNLVNYINQKHELAYQPLEAASESSEQELLLLLSQQWPEAIISLNQNTLCLSIDATEQEALDNIKSIHQTIEQAYGIRYQLAIEAAVPRT